MKVLQVLPTLDAGGAEGFIANLCVSLAERGVEVKLFLMAGARGERGEYLSSKLSEAGVQIIGKAERNIRSLRNIFCLAKLIRTWRPSIVQANLFSAEVMVAVSRLLTFRSRTFYCRRLTNTKIYQPQSSFLVRILDRAYRCTIACSQVVADTYQAFSGDREKKENCVAVIQNGSLVKEQVTSFDDKRAARESLKLSKNAFVVVNIGRMDGSSLTVSQKAHNIILSAFAKAFGGKEKFVLVLLGDGPLREELSCLAESLEISGQVRFLGKRSEPWLVLMAADVFFFPSRHEGMPNVLPEAASCGLPILASDIPEIRSIAVDQPWRLNPVDDVDAFAEGLHLMYRQYASFIKSAVDAAPMIRNRFSMQVCAEKYVDFYMKCLNL